MSATIGPTGTQLGTAVHVDAAPVVETPLQKAVDAAAKEIETATIAAQPHASAAVIDQVFLAHFNNLPVACEMPMRPIIEAARKDLKAALAAA